MFARLGATAAVTLLAAVIATSAHAQSSVRILEARADGAEPPSAAEPLAISDNDFPLASLTEAQEGTVVLNLLVDSQGRVTFAQRLTSSGSDLLDQTAQQIARTRWTFQPARKEGEALVGSVKVEVNWKLPLRPADEFSTEMIGIPVLGRTVTQPKSNPETNRVRAGDYPIASVRRGEQGEIALRVEVLENGKVGEVQLLDSSGFRRLDESATEAVKRFTYEPGTIDGQPTRMSTYVMVQFNLGPRFVGRRPPALPLPVARTYCHSRPILTAPILVNAEATNEQVDLRQWAHADASGAIDDVLILTTKGWMRFNQPLVENLSRVAGLPPAARANRPPSCWFNASLAVRPMVENSAEALLQRGVANRRLNDADRAIEDYTKAIAINPNLATAYNARAVAYSTKGEYDNALRDHDQAIRLSPNMPAHLGNRGITYLKQGRFEEAIKDFDQVIKLNPRIAFGFNNRCFALAASGKPRQGIADCDRALRLTPGSALTLDARGYSYLRMANYQAAIADYDAAIKADPKAVDPLYGRGVAKIKSGNAADGNADIAEAIKIDPQIAERMAKIGVTP